MSFGGVPLWGWWILLVLLVSAPWFGFTPSPQWDRLYLVPFSDPDDKPRDLLSNIALFVPFGYSFLEHRRRRRLASTVVAAVAVSMVAEASQLFSTMRNPSGTDVSMAGVGASLGGALRLWFEKHGPPARPEL